MDILFCVLCGIFLCIGFLGTFVPVLPGAPLAFAGLVFAYFSGYTDISLTMLIITGVVAVVVSVLDNILKMWSWVPQLQVVVMAIGLIGDKLHNFPHK